MVAKLSELFSVSKEDSQSMEMLIIDDSLAIILLLKKFLKKIGYENVQYTLKGSEGVELFREMVKSGKEPVVFLDFDLGDTNGLDIIIQLLAIKPSTKVIIETAISRGEDVIRKCISNGAYNYLEKPIRLENLKQVLQVLNAESDTVTEDKKVTDTIDCLIKSSTQLVLTKIVETTHFKPEVIARYLKKLESENIIKSIGDIKQVSCNGCESVNVSQTFYCPNCHNSNFNQGRLIEHYECGYVALAEEFEDYVCPQCQKRLKARGVDHKATENYYVCQECGDKFPEPYFNYVCQKCDNKFPIEDAKWISSPGYHILKQNEWN